MSWEVATVLSVFLICCTAILIIVPKPTSPKIEKDIQEVRVYVDSLREDIRKLETDHETIKKQAEETKAMLSTAKLASSFKRN